MSDKKSKKEKSSKSESKRQRKAELPPNIEQHRTRATLNNFSISNVHTVESPSAYHALGVDNSFNLEKFKENFKVNVIENHGDELVVDMIGIDPPIANAFRRILIAEVPTMAIDKIWMYSNTSVIQDEVLSHRIGLIPLRANPDSFKYLTNEEYTTDSTLVFSLQVQCELNPDAAPDAPESERYINSNVYSSMLKWEPEGDQAQKWSESDVGPIHDDILIAKLRPGQQIDLLAYALKGIGSTHAKWSPVATASYRLMPEITFKKEISGKDAETLAKMCPMNVFDIEDLGSVKSVKAARPRNCSMCRECIRDPYWDERVGLARVKDHFIFSIESTGAMSPLTLLKQAVQILYDKCADLEDAIKLAT